MPRRRADWLAGRLAAKAVVAAALGEILPGEWPARAIEIATEPGGRPCARLAPELAEIAGLAPGELLPVSVTISHVDACALCAAAPWRVEGGGARRALGIDLGRIEPRSPAFLETFLVEDERRFVRDAAGRERDVRANLVWCAKEAVLKAVGLGLTVDTLELSCRPGVDLADPAEWRMAPSDGDWRPFVATCGPALLPGGGNVLGIWRTFSGFVGALASHVRPL